MFRQFTTPPQAAPLVFALALFGCEAPSSDSGAPFGFGLWAFEGGHLRDPGIRACRSRVRVNHNRPGGVSIRGRCPPLGVLPHEHRGAPGPHRSRRPERDGGNGRRLLLAVRIPQPGLERVRQSGPAV